MKKSDFDFSKPIRQSYIAIAIIVYKTFKVIFRQALPFVLIFFLGKGSKTVDYILYPVIVLSLISLVLSIIGYFRFYFYIKGNELIVQKGVIKRKTLNIDFDRIQTINFEQNLIQQIFGVVGLVVDTAGSKKNEFSFDALDRDMAVALRDTILSAKRKQNTSDTPLEKSSITQEEESLISILKLEIPDLIKIGVSQNHLRSLGLIIAFFFWVGDNLRQAGINSEQYAEDYFMDLSNPFTFMLFMFPLLILVSFVISLITTVFKYFDLNLWRGSKGFKISSGLFNKKEVAAMDHKIQMITWSDNPLKRLLGIKDLHFKQASSEEVNSKKSISVAGCYDHHIQAVKRHYFKKHAFDHLQEFEIDRRYIYRQVLYFGLIPGLILITIPILFSEASLLWFCLASIFWIAYSFITNTVKHKKRRYSINKSVFHMKKGLFGNSEYLLKLLKIQNIQITQTFYQRRQQLANLKLYTASGNVTVPYIDLNQAQSLRDYLMYKVETNKEKWM